MLKISPEVAQHLSERKPVVALESTIVAHGMPYPQNVETALRVEATVRANGALPATIAIINGRLQVGLSADELELLGKEGPKVAKASRRDLPYLIAQKKLGATTVASTMIGAQMAGIRMFVTGGIGGVHRGAQETFDISADLIELSKTSVAVVCAGAKSILDIGLTLEYLETFGVPVVGYQTDEFPAFYARKSGFGVDCRINTPQEFAEMAKVKWEMGLEGGILVANPVPEAYALDGTGIDNIIEEALAAAKSMGIKGKAVTPFLLKRIKEQSQGESLEANIALVSHNAAVGAQLSAAFAEIWAHNTPLKG